MALSHPGNDVGVSACAGYQGAAGVADVQPGHAVDAGAAEGVGSYLVGRARGGGFDFEVAPGDGRQGAAGGDLPADVVQVGPGHHRDAIAVDAPAQVLDVVCRDADDASAGQTSRNRPAVGQVAGEVQVDAAASEQGAARGQVTVFDAHVHLGHQSLLLGAVCQSDILLDQPDDVGGELRHLRGAQGDAGAQLVLSGIGDASVHQGLVLLLVAAVACQKALAGQLAHLLPDQALLVEAVAQALLQRGRVY